MKKKIASLLIAVVFAACAGDLDVLDENVKLSIEVPDTVYIGKPVCIKGSIDKPLDIRLYLDREAIGVLKPFRDSLYWTPVAVDTGYHWIQSRVDINPGGELYRQLEDNWGIYVMEAAE